MSDISLTMIRHQGEVTTLGRNVAVKMLLEKSAPKPSELRSVWNVARVVWRRPFLRAV